MGDRLKYGGRSRTFVAFIAYVALQMSYLELAEEAARRAKARTEMDQPVPPLTDEKAELRRQRLLAKVASVPGLLYAVETEYLSDGSLVVAMVTPGATLELKVPPPIDPLDFTSDLIGAMERHTCDQSDVSDKRGTR